MPIEWTRGSLAAPVEARGDQHRAQLPAPRQRRLEPRTLVVLA